MNIKTYFNLDVEMIRSTHDPAELIDMAAKHCLTRPENIGQGVANERLIAFLLSADHTNPLEHVVYTFRINNLSRSGLAQLTRHRIASYTVSSQHYQEYSDYPFIIHPGTTQFEEWEEAFTACMKAYHRLIQKGVPKEEARQVLPNAMGCGLIMTINARSLVNFLRLRLCRRNCYEIATLAWSIRDLVVTHCPEIWEKVHTMCVMDGKCNQGAMTCGNPYPKEV